MGPVVLLCLASALVAGAVGIAGVVRKQRSLRHWVFLAGMLALALESAFAGASLATLAPDEISFWQRLRMLTASTLPGVWMLFSLTYSRDDPRQALSKGRSVLILGFATILLGILGFQESFVVTGTGLQTRLGFQIGRSIFLINLLLLLSSVAILTNLERTFRASTGTTRWRIKFIVIGLSVLFGVRIYTASQALLFISIDPAVEAPLQAGALLIACALIGWSFSRSDSFSMDIHPSGEILHKSMTLFLTGVYLAVVGALAKLLALLGSYTAFPLEGLVVLMSLALLLIVLLSERIRLWGRRFVSRHFKRPFHDYRQVWMAFTEQTSSLLEEAELCREVAKLTSETFQVLSLTIWLVDEHQRLVIGASTSLQPTDDYSPPKDQAVIAGLIEAMREHPHPVKVDECNEAWVETLKSCNPDFFQRGGSRVCMPLVAQNEVLGLMSLGDRVEALPFSSEDNDLLKCIGEQVAASLLSLQLSRRLLRAKELEAFQAMSAFFVHDLKNTTHSLSLLLQNLPSHFQDPAFRQDAVRAVSNSVRHLTELIGRLSLLRQKLEVNPKEVDLNALVISTLEGMHLPPGEAIVKELRPPPWVLADPGLIQNVLVNLVLNSRDAAKGGGTIEISTGVRHPWAVFSVQDQGCGMSPEFISKYLFRPFRTTKKTGLGIGMFHSKAIVDAHHGKIEIESEVGKGTTVRILLPMAGKQRSPN